jgi:hypothetical protein
MKKCHAAKLLGPHLTMNIYMYYVLKKSSGGHFFPLHHVLILTLILILSLFIGIIPTYRLAKPRDLMLLFELQISCANGNTISHCSVC